MGRVGVDLQRVGLEWTLGWAQSRFHSPKCLMGVVYCCSVHHAKQMAPGEMEPLPVCRSSDEADPGGDGLHSEFQRPGKLCTAVCVQEATL